ncbi:Sugar isomerase (SIS) [Macleaya cordata]|uniref:Sugar isomerase (SIS) n=1 Tax=Macleaya cordata TaxID=56857 RepID=A0A200QUK2_MACCD|nr:Sugar isomerase (SIS) [Macleaya cordata]
MADDQRSSSSSMSAMASQICNQISSVFSRAIQNPSVHSIAVEEISAAVNRKGRVFVHGVGREGLMLKALCMRLSHLGLSAHCVGDMTTPPISSSDLLIASAGPGGFSTVDAICGVARSNGARVLLFTAQPESGSATRYATAIGFIPAQTMADDDDAAAHHGSKEDEDRRELLPMGSVYEGAMFVLFEMIVFELGQILGQTPNAIRSRHTNLE